MINYQSDLENLHEVVKDIYARFRNGVVILRGDLASGKTTFVKALVSSLGVEDDVTSPTFSLQQCYAEKLFHYDIYNHGLQHFISLGMLEELEKDGLHLVEWGDEKLVEILNSADIKNITIFIEKLENNSREYRIDYEHA